MVFQVLVEVDEDTVLRSGLELPVIFRNKIPKSCKMIKLVNYRNIKFKVGIEIASNKKVKMVGGAWKDFVAAIEFPATEKLCFKWIRKTTFSVGCFASDNIEYQIHAVRGITMHRCLVEVTDQIFIEQEPPPLFLWECNNRRRRCDNLVVRVVGPRQASSVEVKYVYPEDEHLGHAVGFQGSKWTFLCLENDIEASQTVMFSRIGGMTFQMDIFTFDGVGIDITADEEEVEDPTYGICVTGNDEGFGSSLGKNHKCSHCEHRHKRNLPRFFKKLVLLPTHRSNLTLPKEFVRSHELHAYKVAVLHFGKLFFTASLEVHLDGRRSGDHNHVVMVTDWDAFLQESGLTEGKVLRFQLNLSKCVAGQVADFDVC